MKDRTRRADTPTLARGTATAFHGMTIDEAAQLLRADPTAGLSSAEAENRLREHGPNRIMRRRSTPVWRKFIRQFNQPLVYILIAACGVTAWLGEWVDSSVILGVVLVNAMVGFLQESKAEKAIEALARMSSTQTTVRRDGVLLRLNSEDLVPGDVVILGAGDLVPADLRTVSAHNLRIDESALTGESQPVQKHLDPVRADTILAERSNLLYAGTLVVSGQAEGIAWATGDQTETGRIARLIASASEMVTPLTRKIAQFANLTLWVIGIVSAATFAVGVARGESPAVMFMAAVALAVGAIPEGLPAAVTIVLAVGVSRMAKRKAIIRRLPAVETLGSTTVICTDKTGTLTENQMTVQKIYAGGRWYAVTGAGYAADGRILYDGQPVDPADYPALEECLRAGVLCNESRKNHRGAAVQIHGDPTEVALLVAAEKGGLVHGEVHSVAPRVDMIPFESEHMFRATLHQKGETGERTIYKVGALEHLLDCCESALDTDGMPKPLDREAVLRASEAAAEQGVRVLGMARRAGDPHHKRLEHTHVAANLTFLGFQCMIDPPRPAAIDAVASCRRAGISVKMITGDHAVTARAIARQVGLTGASGAEPHVVSGRELEKVPAEDLPDFVSRADVFARVAPEQKLRLVEALQSRGHVVAMTGDGVNDAPALRQADIGVAMGASGTDVAKGAASMVLTDDNFATIEAAIEEGRGVFDNLVKFIVWTLPTNAGEASVLLTAILIGSILPALPVQLLWVNMTTAIFLGLMLVFEPKEPGLMNRPPRKPGRPILTFPLIMRTGLVSLIILAGAYWIFLWMGEIRASDAAARTAVINVIVFVEIGYLFNCRSLNRSLVSVGILDNPHAIAGALAMAALQLAFTYAPVMNTLFHTAPLDGECWIRILAVAVISFTVVEIEKWIRFRGPKATLGVPD